CVRSHVCMSSRSVSFSLSTPTEIYSLSLHDALPILISAAWLVLDVPPPQHLLGFTVAWLVGFGAVLAIGTLIAAVAPSQRTATRSEEHTSELQSRENLVCRLLLEKKNYIICTHILQV